MNVVATFDPSLITSDTFPVPCSSGHGKMVIWNESSISLQLSFQNGHTAYVPAWTGMVYPTPPGSVNVSWQQHTVLNSTNPPLSQVIVVTYDSSEALPGTFPVALMRQTNVGNSVGTV